MSTLKWMAKNGLTHMTSSYGSQLFTLTSSGGRVQQAGDEFHPSSSTEESVTRALRGLFDDRFADEMSPVPGTLEIITGHGGVRVGAGRGPIMGEAAKRRQITAIDDVWEWLMGYGEGNASEGLRRLYAERRK